MSQPKMLCQTKSSWDNVAIWWSEAFQLWNMFIQHQAWPQRNCAKENGQMHPICWALSQWQNRPTSFGTPHARNHEDLLALWVAFNTETMYQTHVLCPSSNLSACRDLFSSGKQLRKRPYREAWGTCKEPWGFAGSLGSLQHRSYALNSCTLSIFQSLSMPWPVLLKNPSPQRIKRPIPRKVPCFIFCCSSWIVKMTTTLWERFNLRTSVTCTTCKSLRV